jgi:cytochrome c oxidase subunit 2
VIFAPSEDRSLTPTKIFASASKPAKSIFKFFVLVFSITAIFVVVLSLLAYSILKFRKRRHGDGRDPAQVYGGNQVELAWTILPVLIVLVLFLATGNPSRAYMYKFGRKWVNAIPDEDIDSSTTA